MPKEAAWVNYTRNAGMREPRTKCATQWPRALTLLVPIPAERELALGASPGRSLASGGRPEGPGAGHGPYGGPGGARGSSRLSDQALSAQRHDGRGMVHCRQFIRLNKLIKACRRGS